MNATIAVLCGGVGAAKFLRGLIEVTEPTEVVGIVNTADDLVLHGLSISPDLDTCTYTLADEINPQTGWGLAHESWQAMQTVKRLGGVDWFNLGDRDLGTHLYRTQRRSQGAALSQITAEIATAFGLSCRLIPMSDDEVRTEVTTTEFGPMSFQEYFVKHRHALTVSAVDFLGAPAASPGPGVLDFISNARRVVIAPSNPIVSIGPLMAVADIRQAVIDRRSDVVAISPIVAGKALKGPADRLMADLGVDPSVVGVAELYRDFASTLIIDEADRGSVDAVRRVGIEPYVCDTIMSDVSAAARLAQRALLDHHSGDRDRGD